MDRLTLVQLNTHGRLQIRENHLLHERVEVDPALPEQLLRLCGVVEEQADRTEAISSVASRIRGKSGRTRLQWDGSAARQPS